MIVYSESSFGLCFQISGKNPGLNNNKSGSKSGSFDRPKPASASKNVVQKSFGNTFEFQYPSYDHQVCCIVLSYVSIFFIKYILFIYLFICF